MRRVTRRRALTEALAGACALTLAGCGATATNAAARSGSTLDSTWIDSTGDGQLQVGPGEPLRPRHELGPHAPIAGTLGTLAHVTDAHVMDASSPARVSFLARLGPPFQSTFRPQEALAAQVFAGAAAAIRALGPELVIQGGDLIDNDQSNELEHALAVVHGGTVTPGSGPHGYYGVQSAANTDPFYYRPGVDAPRHPGLLRAATRAFVSRGLGARAYPVLGDHDALVAGELVPTDLTRSLAVGDRALWHLPAGLTLPPGVQAGALASPDGPPDPGIVDQFLRQALNGETVTVPPDPQRRELAFAEVVSRLRAAAADATPGATGTGDRLDYTVDVGRRLRLIVVDLVRRAGGSGGLVAPDHPAWLERELQRAGSRWVIVVYPPAALRRRRWGHAAGVAGPLAAGDRHPGRSHPPQPDPAESDPGRRLLADHHRVPDRLPPAGPRPARGGDGAGRGGDPDLDARPRLPRHARDDRP